MLVLVLAAFAVTGSAAKWRTILYIFGCSLLGLAIGAGVALALKNPEAGGSLSGVLIILLGAGSSIQKIIENRKRKGIL